MEKTPSAREEPIVATTSDSEKVDRALEYLKEHDESPVSESGLRRVRWKVDRRLLPLMFFTYGFQFLDKVAFNYAAVMGLPKDLGLQGNDYTNAATITYAAYFASEVLSVIALQKMPAARWLGISAIVWGISCAATAGCHNYATLLVARVFLGLAEASVGPCLIALNSQWYRKDEQAARLNFLYLGLGVGQICGGLMSYGFQGVRPGAASLSGWRIMFLTFGGATIVLGLCLLVFIPASPMQAKWLSEREKTGLLKHLSSNRTGVENYSFTAAQILETFVDPQVWLLMFCVIISSTSAGIGTTYSSTLVSLLGFEPRRAALLNTPGGAVMVVSTLLTGILTRYGILNRVAAFCTVTSIGLIGACLLAFIPSPTPTHPNQYHENLPKLLAGLYLINAQVPSLSLQYSWAAANIAGATKKAIVYSLVSACFALGSIIGLQTFQSRDIPSGYRPAKVAVVGMQIGSMVFALLLAAYYYWQNRKKQAKLDADGGMVSDESSGAWKGMSDREDPLFRYSY